MAARRARPGPPGGAARRLDWRRSPASGSASALWGIEGIVQGDAPFHLGRIRKLDDLGSLSLRAVDEFKDGGLHPGYAFPLWHGWLALVAKLAHVDPTVVVLHEPSILAPLAFVLALEMGRVVFRSTWLGLATMLVQVSLIALAPGGGGAYTSLELPGTVARQLLIPATITLFFRYVRGGEWPVALTLAAAGMDLAFVHPTYALFVAMPLVGFAVARLLVARVDARRSAVGLFAFGVPVMLVFAWLEPIVAETRSHNPATSELLRGLHHYASDLIVPSHNSYHLAPGVVARTGAIAVAALVLVPLAALAGRRRWSAFVLGGTALVLVPELWWLVFPHFSDLVSLSQSRRAAGFVPFAIALVGGATVLTRLLRVLVLPVALAAGIVLQRRFPGDFGLHLQRGGPAVVDVDRALGVARRDRRRGGARLAALGAVRAAGPAGDARDAAVRAARRGARIRPVAHGRDDEGPLCAHTRSRALPAPRRAGALDRLLRPADELPHLGLRARVRRGRSADACRRHEGEQPLCARGERQGVPAGRGSGDSVAIPRRLARAPSPGADAGAGGGRRGERPAAGLPRRQVRRLPSPGRRDAVASGP